MMALGMCLVAAGCSKGDDGLDIEKTYAEDDFETSHGDRHAVRYMRQLGRKK